MVCYRLKIKSEAVNVADFNVEIAGWGVTTNQVDTKKSKPPRDIYSPFLLEENSEAGAGLFIKKKVKCVFVCSMCMMFSVKKRSCI